MDLANLTALRVHSAALPARRRRPGSAGAWSDHAAC